MKKLDEYQKHEATYYAKECARNVNFAADFLSDNIDNDCVQGERVTARDVFMNFGDRATGYLPPSDCLDVGEWVNEMADDSAGSFLTIDWWSTDRIVSEALKNEQFCDGIILGMEIEAKAYDYLDRLYSLAEGEPAPKADGFRIVRDSGEVVGVEYQGVYGDTFVREITY